MTIEEQEVLYQQITNLFLLALCFGFLFFALKWLKNQALKKQERQSSSITKGDPFNGFIGNERVVSILRIYLAASSSPNLLFSGPRSVGKTELAKRYAKAKGSRLVTLEKTSLAPARFKKILLDLPAEQPILFFVDEVHALPAAIQDMLLTACEPNDKKITLLGTVFDLKRCGFIAATTNIGKLSSAFQSRFTILEMEEYTEADIAEILMWKFPESTIFTHSFLKTIARYSKLVPRVAIQGCEYLLLLLKQDENLNEIELEAHLKLYFDCDESGLTKQDREYLEIVSRLQPVSSQTLCSMLCVDKDTLENSIEPFLMKNGFIRKTNKGRCLNEKTNQKTMG